MTSEVTILMDKLKSIDNQIRATNNPKLVLMLLKRIAQELNNPILKAPIKLLEEVSKQEDIKIDNLVEATSNELHEKKRIILEYAQHTNCENISSTLERLRNHQKLCLLDGFYLDFLLNCIKEVFEDLSKLEGHQDFIKRHVQIREDGSIDVSSISKCFWDLMGQEFRKNSELLPWLSLQKIMEFKSIIDGTNQISTSKSVEIQWIMAASYQENCELKHSNLDEYKIPLQTLITYLNDNITCGELPDEMKLTQKDIMITGNELIIHENSKEPFDKGSKRLKLVELIVPDIHKPFDERDLHPILFSKDSDDNFIAAANLTKDKAPLDTKEKKQLRDIVIGANQRILNEMYIRDLIVYENGIVQINPHHLKKQIC